MKLRKCTRMGITIFKIIILGDIRKSSFVAPTINTTLYLPKWKFWIQLFPKCLHSMIIIFFYQNVVLAVKYDFFDIYQCVQDSCLPGVITNQVFVCQCHVLVAFANSLDSDQAWQNVRPDLDPNCLTIWWYSCTNFVWKSWFWQKKADTKRMQNIPAFTEWLEYSTYKCI